MNWIVLLYLGAILLYTPFKRGLFFSQDLYLVSSLLCAGFVLWLLWVWIRKDRAISKKYFAVFLLPLVYALTFLVAKSPGSNFDHLLGWLGFASFFVMLLWVRHQKDTGKWLPHLFGATGIAISYFSIFGVWGWVTYKDLMLEDRLTGPLQYANTFATIIGAFWMFSLIWLSKKRIAWWETVLFSLPLVAYGVGFFHSYSRGALVVFPVVWLLGLVALKAREQLYYIAATAVSLLSSLVVFRILIEQEEAGATNPGLLAFILGTLIVVGYALLVATLNRKGFFERLDAVLSGKGWLRFVAPALAVVAGMLLFLDIQNQGAIYRVLPSTLQERVGAINLETASAAARIHMYGDAWEIVKDYPLLGLGGEGWKAVYPRYQTAPYLSNEVHNGYLDILVNTGWVGLILFLTVLGYFITQLHLQYWRKSKDDDFSDNVAVLAALAFVFLHAFIDFDLSYGYVWLFVFWLMAMGLPGMPHPIFPQRKAGKASLISPNFRTWTTRIVQGLIIIVVGVGSVFSLRFYTGGLEVEKIMNSEGPIDINDGLRVFQNATEHNPYSVSHWIGLSNMYAYLYNYDGNETYRDLVLEALNRAERLEPDNPSTLRAIAAMYNNIGQPLTAGDYMEKAIHFDPYNVLYYEEMFSTYRTLMSQSSGEQLSEISEKVIDYYEKYMGWYKEWKGKPLPDPRTLTMSDSGHEVASVAYNITQQYSLGLEAISELDFVMDPALVKEDGSFANVPYQLIGFKEYINGYKNQTMIISVRDEAASKLSSETKQYLAQLGFRLDQMNYRDSYVGVVHNNRVIFEQIGPEKLEVQADQVPELASIFQNHSVKVISAGFNVGNISSIVVDGKEYSINRRGFNIAVFDESMNILDRLTFDTFISEKIVVPLNR